MNQDYIQSITALLPHCEDESLLDLIYKLLIAECGNNCSNTVVLLGG